MASFPSRWKSVLTGSRKDYFSTFLATGIIQGCGVISGILTARLLGPAGKGEVATVLWLPSLMVSAGILSLPQASAFYASRHPHQDDSITGTGFWMSVGLGLAEAAFLYPFMPLILGSRGTHLIDISRIFLLYLPIAYCGLTLLGIDQGLQRFTRFNVLRILPVVFYIISLIVLALFKKPTVSNVLLTNLFAQLIASGIRIALAGKRLILCDIRIGLDNGKKLLKQGFIYSLPALSGIILMRADLALLIHMVSSEQVGFYSAAMAIAMGQTGISASLIQVNFPRVSSISREQAEHMLWRHFKKSLIPILGMGLLVALCSPLIVRYLFGERFLPALPMAYVLVAAISIWGIGQVLENGLRGMGYGAPGALANFLGFVFLLASSPFLINKLKGEGMAVAMLLSQLVVLTVLIMLLRRISNTRFKRELRHNPLFI